MKIQMLFHGKIEAEIPDGLEDEALDEAIAKERAKIPGPPGMSGSTFKVDDNGNSHLLTCEARHCAHYGCSDDEDWYAFCSQCEEDEEEGEERDDEDEEEES